MPRSPDVLTKCPLHSGNQCTVYIDGARNVTAQFSLSGNPLFKNGFE